MAKLSSSWQAYMDQQHQHPSGLVGRYVGERMIRQHATETAWSIDLLCLEPADRVLELGCGAGQALALMSRQVASGDRVGLDRSSAMLRSAARRNRQVLRSGQMALLCGDLSALPVAEGSFDKIVTIHTFYFWDDPPSVLSGLLRVLKPGGRIVITLATGKRLSSGEMQYWPIHERIRMVGEQVAAVREANATLHVGPDSRSYNNVALVLWKSHVPGSNLS